MMAQRRLNDEQVELLAKLYRRGWSRRRLGVLVGATLPTVTAALQSAGVVIRQSGKPRREFDIQRAASLRAQGRGWKAIARDLGVPKTTVRRHLTQFASTDT